MKAFFVFYLITKQLPNSLTNLSLYRTDQNKFSIFVLQSYNTVKFTLISDIFTTLLLT